jgi:Uma2 family endonuclease
MTYTPTRYQSYQDYLEDEDISPDDNYRLLSTGELIEVSSEDDANLMIAHLLSVFLSQIAGGAFKKRVRNGNKEFQVLPVGDGRVNRKPDVMVMHPEHLEVARQAITFGMQPPLFVAEVVSPGDENSSNYKRDYLWKREQYQWWQIPEFWIIDPHREKVTVLVLVDGIYQKKVYSKSEQITSVIFSDLTIKVQDLLTGDL